jgi:hypothetical protein
LNFPTRSLFDQMVLSGHVEEILLRLEEMADRSGK